MKINDRMAWGFMGGVIGLNEPTEAELLAYIMANFPPNLFIDPEQGIVDSSGNNVTVTPSGSPTLNASGGLNNRGYISFDGVDDALIVDRVDNLTHAIVFRNNNAAQFILNVPTANTGGGDAPKFIKQGIQYASSKYRFLPDSGGSIVPAYSELTDSAPTWRTFLCKPAYFYNNGQSAFASNSTVLADTTVTKMFYAAWGRGDGTLLAAFGQIDLGLSMIWNTQLTKEQLGIVHAYFQKRFASYGDITYLYKPETLSLEATNPVFDGNVNSGSTQDQAYSGQILGEGSAVFKGLTKDLYGFSSVDSNLVTWSDEPLVLVTGGGGSFDENGINHTLFFKEGSTYYLVYTGRNASTEFQIGLATSSSPLSGYTKDGSNPIISLADLNVPLSKTYDFIQTQAIIKVGATYYIFLTCGDIGGTDASDIVMMSGNSLTTFANPIIKLTLASTPIKSYLVGTTANRDTNGWPQFCRSLQIGGIHRYGGKIVAMIASGTGSDELVTAKSTVIFALIADDDGNFNFKCIGNDLLIDTGGTSTWNKTMSYNPDILKDDNLSLTPKVVGSNHVIYFAGLGTTAEAINTKGQTGFAYAPNKRIVKKLLN